MAAGAEAMREGIEQQAIDGGWSRAEWYVRYIVPLISTSRRDRFKLHVRSQSGTSMVQLEEQLPPLPPNKTIIQVIADYLTYLYECTKQYIIDTHPSGAILWSSVKDEIHYILTHPNGWEGYQQTQMRDAVVLAGLLPYERSEDRITFLTEGEASLHYAIRNGLPSGAMNVSTPTIVLASLL